MSMNSYSVYGIGFNVEANEEDYKSFIVNHEATIKELYPNFAEKIETMEIDDIEETFDCGCCGIADLLREIISHEIGYELRATQEDGTGDMYLVFCAQLPWDFTEREKSLSVKEVLGTLDRYAEELNCNPSEYCDILEWS